MNIQRVAVNDGRLPDVLSDSWGNNRKEGNQGRIFIWL
jgi:hypothetical protein